MFEANCGRGRGRTVRNGAGRDAPQPAPQHDPAENMKQTASVECLEVFLIQLSRSEIILVA